MVFALPLTPDAMDISSKYWNAHFQRDDACTHGKLACVRKKDWVHNKEKNSRGYEKVDPCPFDLLMNWHFLIRKSAQLLLHLIWSHVSPSQADQSTSNNPVSREKSEALPVRHCARHYISPRNCLLQLPDSTFLLHPLQPDFANPMIILFMIRPPDMVHKSYRFLRAMLKHMILYILGPVFPRR